MGGWHGGPDAGVVDQDVDVAESLDCGLDEPVAVLGKRYVCADGEAPPPGDLDSGPGRLEPVRPAGGQDHVGAGFGERGREGDAES